MVALSSFSYQRLKADQISEDSFSCSLMKRSSLWYLPGALFPRPKDDLFLGNVLEG
jgi:hypothetical protein